MGSIVSVSSLSAADLAALQLEIEAETARRERLAGFVGAWLRCLGQVREFAQACPPVPFESPPTWENALTGFVPGQRVVYEGRVWRNDSQGLLVTVPGVDGWWTDVTPEPEPDPEPEPEPDPDPEPDPEPGTEEEGGGA